MLALTDVESDETPTSSYLSMLVATLSSVRFTASATVRLGIHVTNGLEQKLGSIPYQRSLTANQAR